jgi:hypothetical protein
MVGNPNAPKKGDRITVDPIRNLDDVKAISKLLKDTPEIICCLWCTST